VVGCFRRFFCNGGNILSVKISMRVQFYDTDEMGVVHHANYIRWFETGRVEYLRRFDLNLNDLIADEILFPIIEVKAKYFHPAHFDDELEIETTARALTKVKMEFDYTVTRRSDGLVLVKGYSENVFTNTKTGKIIKLPDKYFAKLEQAMIAEAEEKNADN